MDRQFHTQMDIKRETRANRFFCNKMMGGVTRRWLIFGLFLLAIFVVSTVIVALSIMFFPEFEHLAIWSFPVLTIFFMSWYVRFVRARNAKFINQADFANQPANLVAGNENLVWQYPGCEVTLDWSAIRHVLQGPEGIIFSYGSWTFHLPNSVFSSDADRDAFRAECEERIAKARAAS